MSCLPQVLIVVPIVAHVTLFATGLWVSDRMYLNLRQTLTAEEIAELTKPKHYKYNQDSRPFYKLHKTLYPKSRLRVWSHLLVAADVLTFVAAFMIAGNMCRV